MATFTLPEPPVQAPVVDASPERKISVPWKGWILDWLTLLQDAIQRAIDSLVPVGLISEITADTTAQAFALVGSADVHLGNMPRLGGSFDIEGSFTPSQVGAPVVTQLFPARLDESEGVLTCARSVVLDEGHMRVYWSASCPLGGPAVVHFAIGGQ